MHVKLRVRGTLIKIRLEKSIKVVADSVIGRSALRIEYRDRCFPPAVIPVSTTTPPAEPIKVTTDGPDVGEDGSVGEFGIGTEPVAVPFGDSLSHNESDVVVFQEDVSCGIICTLNFAHSIVHSQIECPHDIHLILTSSFLIKLCDF